MDTVLVLSGVTKREDLLQFPYQPKYILNSIIVYVILDE